MEPWYAGLERVGVRVRVRVSVRFTGFRVTLTLR